MAALLHHVNIRALDLAATIAFYVEAVGLTEGWRPPFGFPGAWLYDGENPVVHLTVGGPGAGRDGAGVDHIAFAYDDLDPVLVRLDRLGARCSPLRRQPGTGVRQIFVLDPNGVAVELQGP